jgi:hypothetical protein
MCKWVGSVKVKISVVWYSNKIKIQIHTFNISSVDCGVRLRTKDIGLYNN